MIPTGHFTANMQQRMRNILDHLGLVVFTTCTEDCQLMYRVYAIEGAKLVCCHCLCVAAAYNDSYPVMDDWYVGRWVNGQCVHIVAYASSRFILTTSTLAAG